MGKCVAMGKLKRVSRVPCGQTMVMGYAVGSTDLRDGRWHHLALVFIGAEQVRDVSAVDGETQGSDAVDMASHVRLYVDGKLELLSGARSNQVMPLGRDSDEELTAFSFGGSASFEGGLDEFYLLDEAASSADVLELYELGKSDGAE